MFSTYWDERQVGISIEGGYILHVQSGWRRDLIALNGPGVFGKSTGASIALRLWRRWSSYERPTLIFPISLDQRYSMRALLGTGAKTPIFFGCRPRHRLLLRRAPRLPVRASEKGKPVL